MRVFAFVPFLTSINAEPAEFTPVTTKHWCPKLHKGNWNCTEDDVCTHKFCRDGFHNVKGCRCTTTGCRRYIMAPTPCKNANGSDSTELGKRRKKSKKFCKKFDLGERGPNQWFCSSDPSDNFGKGTVCTRTCYNWGVAIRRCQCQRKGKKCIWRRRYSNNACFKIPSGGTREEMNLFNRPEGANQLPLHFLRDFVSELADYNDEEATTFSTTTDFDTEDPLQLPEIKPLPIEEVKHPSHPSTTALQAAVETAGAQINEWVEFLKELLHFNQLTVIAIDSGTLKPGEKDGGRS